jgi:hypothetical protein
MEKYIEVYLNEKYENMAKVSDVAYEPSAHSICEEKK